MTKGVRSAAGFQVEKIYDWDALQGKGFAFTWWLLFYSTYFLTVPFSWNDHLEGSKNREETTADALGNCRLCELREFLHFEVAAGFVFFIYHIFLRTTLSSLISLSLSLSLWEIYRLWWYSDQKYPKMHFGEFYLKKKVKTSPPQRPFLYSVYCVCQPLQLLLQ